jgi:hypothetical protein
MDEDACRVELVIGVAADMRPAINDDDPLPEVRCEALGDHAPSEAGTHDDDVSHAGNPAARRIHPLRANADDLGAPEQSLVRA